MCDFRIFISDCFGDLLKFVWICSVCRDSDVGAGSERSYWAKGTGFGTGSTSSGWDVEQAMLKQKAEEEHVTCLLQVMTVELTAKSLLWGRFKLFRVLSQLILCAERDFLLRDVCSRSV